MLGGMDESLLDQSPVLAQVTLESSPDGQRHLIRTLARIDTAVIRAAREHGIISVALRAGFMHAGDGWAAMSGRSCSSYSTT